MAKFEPGSYSQYRIYYPSKLFDSLKPYCVRGKDSDPLRVFDLGSGTGLSAASFLRTFPDCVVTLVEPDAAMMEASFELPDLKLAKVTRISANAESFETGEQADVILVGSAWHWMNFEKTIPAILKALKPGGILFIFEYQFPKAKGPVGATLNEWVRREFNLRWKPEYQKPRGTLRELTESVRLHPEMNERARSYFEETREIESEDFFGLITSQSRFLDFEKGLSKEGALELRNSVAEAIAHFIPRETPLDFIYHFESYLFQRRSV